MRHTPVSLLSRCTALLCAVAWFVASNHCALAALVDGFAKRDAAVQCSHCPTKDQSGGNSGAPMSGCCKGIKATTPTSAKAVFVPALGSSIVAVVVAIVQTPQPPRVEICAGTGPPRMESFAESILTRSFQSHAPPLFG